MDISRFKDLLVKNNHLVGLGFPRQGYIFFRCVNSEDIIYSDYTESPGSIAADTQESSARLPISDYSIDNMLRVTDCDHLYQVFMGWKPGAVRQYLYYPFETARRNLDVKGIYTKSKFGYIDGYESEYDRPSPLTELFIPKNVDVGFSWWNPLNNSVSVALNIFIHRMEVDVLRDVDLVARILAGTQPCRIVTLGGVGASIDFNARDVYDVDFIKLGASREEIEAALSRGS